MKNILLKIGEFINYVIESRNAAIEDNKRMQKEMDDEIEQLRIPLRIKQAELDAIVKETREINAARLRTS